MSPPSRNCGTSLLKVHREINGSRCLVSGSQRLVSESQFLVSESRCLVSSAWHSIKVAPQTSPLSIPPSLMSPCYDGNNAECDVKGKQKIFYSWVQLFILLGHWNATPRSSDMMSHVLASGVCWHLLPLFFIKMSSMYDSSTLYTTRAR